MAKTKLNFVRINIAQYKVIGYHGSYVIKKLDSKHKYNRKTGNYDLIETTKPVQIGETYHANLIQCMEFLKRDLLDDIPEEDIESFEELLTLEKCICGYIEKFGKKAKKQILKTS